MRRTRYNILKGILEKCRGEAIGVTQLMYSCQLSFSQTRQYVQELVTKGFLSITTVKREGKTLRGFRTTPTGAELSKRLREIELLLDNPDEVFNVATATTK